MNKRAMLLLTLVVDALLVATVLYGITIANRLDSYRASKSTVSLVRSVHEDRIQSANPDAIRRYADRLYELWAGTEESFQFLLGSQRQGIKAILWIVGMHLSFTLVGVFMKTDTRHTRP